MVSLLQLEEEPTCLKAAWDLMEIFYVDKQARAWLPERLVDWLAVMIFPLLFFSAFFSFFFFVVFVVKIVLL